MPHEHLKSNPALTPSTPPRLHCSNFCHRGLIVECPEDFVCRGASPYPCVQRCPCDGGCLGSLLVCGAEKWHARLPSPTPAPNAARATSAGKSRGWPQGRVPLMASYCPATAYTPSCSLLLLQTARTAGRRRRITRTNPPVAMNSATIPPPSRTPPPPPSPAPTAPCPAPSPNPAPAAAARCALWIGLGMRRGGRAAWKCWQGPLSSRPCTSATGPPCMEACPRGIQPPDALNSSL